MAINKSLPVGSRQFQASSIATSRSVAYRDIDLTLETKPGVELFDSDGISTGFQRGDVYKKLDAAAIIQSLKTLLLTNRFEKPFQPSFGGDLQRILFDNADTYTENDISNLIKGAVQQYEPRALIDTIYVDLGPYGTNDVNINSISVTIVFRIANSSEQTQFTTVLNRLR